MMMCEGRKGVRELAKWALPRPLTPNRVGALSLGGHRSVIYKYLWPTRYEPVDPFFCWSFAALNLLAFSADD
jgi:hypothetical protein